MNTTDKIVIYIQNKKQLIIAIEQNFSCKIVKNRYFWGLQCPNNANAYRWSKEMKLTKELVGIFSIGNIYKKASQVYFFVLFFSLSLCNKKNS